MEPGHELIRFSKALASETRVRILYELHAGGLCVGALSARLNVTQGAVSQHLRVLREAGLVVSEKCGYYVHYRLNPKAFARFEKAMADLFKPCEKKGGHSCLRKKTAAAKSRKT